MQQKTERFEMRFDQDALKRVDDWRGAQPDLPSRAEAIRRLVASGLSKSQTRFKPNGAEKLIISMLCSLHRHLHVHDDGIDPDFIDKAAVDRHHWALEWEYEGMFQEAVDEETAMEVAQILDMWWTIEQSYDLLSDEDRAKLQAAAGITQDQIAFPGFDGNNEFTHYDVAKFMIDGLRRFRHFEGRDLNSHRHFLRRYRRMLVLYESMRAASNWGNQLSQSQIDELINLKG